MKKRLHKYYSLVKSKLPIFIIFLHGCLSAQVQLGQDITGFDSDVSIGLSSDGSILAIGSKRTGSSGFVQIYERMGGDWTQIGANIDAEALRDESGGSISLSADGTIVAIGAQKNSGGGLSRGHVRVYQRLGDSWMQLGQDIDGEADGDESSRNVSLSADGHTVAISASNNDGNGDNAGHVRIFRLDNTNNWVQLGQDLEGENPRDYLGTVSINANGSIVAIGSQNNSNNGLLSGQVRIYQWNGSNRWIQLGQEITGKSERENFGVKLTMTPDGTRIVVGSEFANDFRGNVRVYQWDNNDSWVQLGSDIIGRRMYSNFGHSISISDTGSVLAIGIPSKNTINGDGSGQARIYKLDESTEEWIQTGNTINGDGQLDGMGESISLSANGDIVSIAMRDTSSDEGGSVRTYALDIVSPSGYTALLDQDYIDASNETEVSFTLANAEVGASYTFTISSSGDGDMQKITGRGTVTSVNQTVTGIDVSSLSDGTIKISLKLRDQVGNVGEEVIDFAEKRDVLSVQDFDKESVKIFPNPIKNTVFITKPMKEIVIYNAVGKKVFQSINVDTSFDVPSLAPGVYYAILMSKENISVLKKLIKQ